MMAATVYLLCALTSLLCAVLLFREYRRHPVPLLFWSSIAFSGLALSNAFLVVDLVLFPTLKLAAVRTVPSLLGLGVLVWGFIWDRT